jgi:hypothetical protein
MTSFLAAVKKLCEKCATLAVDSIHFNFTYHDNGFKGLFIKMFKFDENKFLEIMRTKNQNSLRETSMQYGSNSYLQKKALIYFKGSKKHDPSVSSYWTSV